MSELVNGMLVQHASLGIGKVVAIEATAVHVFFPESEKRFAAKLRWPVARPLLRTEGVEQDAWLSDLSPFSFDVASGRYALPAGWLTPEQAIADFLAQFPGGFADPAYLGNPPARRSRASRWRAAQLEWARIFGSGDDEQPLAAGDIRELVARALRMEESLALVSGPFQRGELKTVFRDPGATRAFFEALIGLLSVRLPTRARHEQLFAAVRGLGLEPGLAWAVATVFPFIADPARHVFLWPRSACAAAERLGFVFRFDETPNWTTYNALRAVWARLLETLKANGARDFVDVEAFLHATVTRRAAAAAPGGPEVGEDPAARTTNPGSTKGRRSPASRKRR